MKLALQEVKKYKLPEPEETVFSAMGMRIGDLELPTTKLLTFFLKPKGGHDLGSIFLRSFFECLEENCGNIDCENATVGFYRTDDNKLPDLVISGPNWVLTIENKIRAPLNNPLNSYKDFAGSYFPGKTSYLAVLSPDGKTDKERPNWKAVTYKKYCNALRRDLAKIDRPISKWQVFAREFIVHLENAFGSYVTTMKPEQVKYMEKYLSEARELKKLADRYIEDLRLQLSERMRTEFPAQGQFIFRNDLRGFFSNVDIAKTQVTLFFKTAFHEGGIPDGKTFQVSIGLGNLSDSQKKRIGELGLPWDPEDLSYLGTESLDDREAAMDRLCAIAKKVFGALET